MKKLSQNWRVLPFVDVVKDSTAGNAKIAKNDYLESGVVPIIDQGQELIGGFTNDLSKIVGVELPVIIFGDHTRIFKFIETPFVLGADGAKILEPKVDYIDKKYLFHYLNQLKIESAGYSRHYKFLKEFNIIVPPLEEQKRIAAILDKADAIRQKRQKAIELADEFLRSVFLDMFGDPVTNPKGWRVHKCQDIFQRITVGVVVKPSSYYVENGVPALRSLNIKSYGIEDNNLVYISKESNESILAKSRVFEGDLVLVRSGQPGKTAVVTKKYDGVNAIDILIATPIKNKILPEYFAFFMNSVGGKNIVVSEQRGQVQQHFNVGSLNAAEVPVPSLELQNKFSKIFNAIKSQYFFKDIEDFSHIFNSLSQKAFSGEL